jgi:hypothetical protein
LGQRKLLFTELEFYTKMLNPGEKALILYAGSASGSHNPPLLKLFNHCEFHFYDKNPFSTKLAPFCKNDEYFKTKKENGEIKKNLTIFDQYFMMEDAENYTPEKRDKKLLFLSDIRTSGYEDGVEEDLQLQQRWCEIIKPDMAMLKMRLRWKPGKTEYFDGDIYTQPRIGPKSTETRLWTNCKTKKIYDNDSYNNRCYYFQKYQRNAFHFLSTAEAVDKRFKCLREKETDDKEMCNLKKKLIDEIPHVQPQIKGMDHCNDCWSEIYIIVKYLIKYRSKMSIVDFFRFLDSPEALDVPPHNLLVNEPNINKRIQILEKKTLEYAKEYKEGRIL